MAKMVYDSVKGAWFGECQGKIMRVEDDTMKMAQALEEQHSLPHYSLNPARWWNNRNKDGVSYTFFTPEHNVLEIVFDRNIETLPEWYRKAFPCTEFTVMKTHHYTIFQADLKGWATEGQLKALSEGFSWGEGPGYSIDHQLSAENARSEE